MLKLECAGRVTGEPKVFNTKTGNKIVSFSVAVSTADMKEVKPAYIDFKVFPPFAEAASRLGKGDPVYVVATGRMESWEKEGKTFNKLVWIPVFMSVHQSSGGARPATSPTTEPADAKADTDDLPF